MGKKVTLRFINHSLHDDLWFSKKDLFNHFFGDFYDFILNHNGKDDLEENKIFSKQDFLEFSADWYAGGKDSCYALGFGFHKYFATANMDYRIENQPTDTYLGYLYHNNKYRDFLNFLMSFFPYWRNDEGCTRFDPYNKCDNPFVSSWAILVDTAKLFCLDADTVYWWQSFRVKYCLDHIPGVILSDFKEEIEFEDSVKLPNIKVAGYQFMGWHITEELESEKVEEAKEECVVYAELLRKDIYNYWEKEEKTIKKVEDPNWKRVDPA